MGIPQVEMATVCMSIRHSAAGQNQALPRLPPMVLVQVEAFGRNNEDFVLRRKTVGNGVQLSPSTRSYLDRVAPKNATSLGLPEAGAPLSAFCALCVGVCEVFHFALGACCGAWRSCCAQRTVETTPMPVSQQSTSTSSKAFLSNCVFAQRHTKNNPLPSSL